jgi:hypothetical protein
MRSAGLLLLLIACGGGGASTATKPPPGTDPFAGDPLATFAGLEDRLVGARKVELTAEVSATGSVTAEISGTLVVEPEVEASIIIDGVFEGTEIESRWASASAQASDTTAPAWAEGILIGLTRMGVLHNWAKIAGGADPDVDVKDAMAVENLAWRGGDPSTRTLQFSLVFMGSPMGEVELTLDDAGLPRHRVQIVHFPEGDMQVLEQYSKFVVAD